MLPSSGYFRTIMCPFSKLGLCTRPHCHYKHSKQDSTAYKVPYSYSSARSTDEYLPESVLRTSSTVISKPYHTQMDIESEENATYIPTPVNKCLKPVGILKTSNSDKPSTSSAPEYKPTPIARLKELNIAQPHVGRTEYIPSYKNSYRKKKHIEEYDPTEVKFVAPKKTVTFADEKMGSLVVPSEIVLSSDEDIDDASSAPKFSDDDFDDDIVVCEPPPKVSNPKDVVEIDVTEDEKIDEYSIVDKILVDSKKSEELIKAFSKPKKILISDDFSKAKQLSQIEDSLDSVNECSIDDIGFDTAELSASVNTKSNATNKCLELIQSSLNQLEKHNFELSSSKSKKFKTKEQNDIKESKSEKFEDTKSLDKSNNPKLSDKSKDVKSEGKPKEAKSLDKSKDKTSDKSKSSKKHDESVSIKKKHKDSPKKSKTEKGTKSSSQSSQGKHTKNSSDSDSTHLKKEKVAKDDKTDRHQKPEKIPKSDKLVKQDDKHKSKIKEKLNVICDKKHSSKPSAAKQDDKLQDGQVSSSSIITKSRAEKVTSKSKNSSSKSSVGKRKSIDVDSQTNTLVGDVSPPSKKVKVNSSSDEAPDLDVSFSSDEDIDEQLWQIYNETFSDPSKDKAEEKEKQETKKVHQEENSISGKKRQAHAAAASLKKPPSITKVEAKKSLNPAQVMHNRYTQLQTMYAQSNKIPQSLLPPARNNDKKRISYAPNPGLIAAVQQKKMLSDNPKLVDFTPLPSTVTKTLKTTHRVAHVPDLAFKPRPIIPADFGSKVPVNVRQKFLNAFIDECLKFCSSEDEAYEMGLEEEKKAYERSSSKPVYMNVAANTLKRLRDRVSQKSEVTTTTNSLKSKKTVSHEMVINGPIAQRTSFSVGKKKQTYDIKDFGGAALYEFLLSYILTEEQLKENGYPFPHPFEPDRAVIEGIYANRIQFCNDAFKRTCSRCQKIYYVNVDGDYVRDEECEYHWGRIWKRRIAGAIESRYNCCQGDSESDGCCVATGHVFEGSENHAYKGFVKTLPKTPPPDRCYGVYSLDCEMCYTTAGSELTRITVIGTDLKPVYESFVKPQNKVLDYNTRFSGITEENLQNVRTTLHDVQAVLLCIFNDKTILIGHSLESDFKALKLFHKVVIDTSVVFPHKNGLPFKRALRTLMAEKLNKIIQNDVGGHDSHEDAAACMELMLWKIQEDLKSNR
ncbi:RNA exonuclease 1 homolog [Uloborus diversus]|uniref:RNA exonuclease 1 homolog n=1 Tax=Uloborus diversus TaxID=327109 RepID=UPI002408FD58|nr:RNA exonuclease 1 homolog [Uloborus diversus]